ncbi:hypothetical protein YC2023_059013 [Brassica napus]
MEETALEIIKAAKDKQVTSNYTGRSESNPATPPPVQGFSIQVLLFPDPSVLYTPPVREEEDLGFDSYYSDVAPARVHNSPSDTRVDTARIKSIIVSPLMETEEVHPRVQETALVLIDRLRPYQDPKSSNQSPPPPPPPPPLVAESIALLNGIEKALHSGINSVTIFSDCSMLVRAINSKSQIKEIYGILQDIDRLSSLFASTHFQHITRSQNKEADLLAKHALKAHYRFFSS